MLQCKHTELFYVNAPSMAPASPCAHHNQMVDKESKNYGFDQRLRALMDERGYSYDAVSALLEESEGFDIDRQQVYHWVKRGDRPSVDVLRALARIFRVNWVWLGFGDEALSESLRSTTTPPPPNDDLEYDWARLRPDVRHHFVELIKAYSGAPSIDVPAAPSTAIRERGRPGKTAGAPIREAKRKEVRK